MNGNPEAGSPPETWLQYADADLLLVQHAVTAGAPAGEVCFHAQQATEKALKALLALARVRPPRTHDLVQLWSLIDDPSRPAANEDQLERLAELESQARYPGDWPEPADEEAAWASELADSVVRAARAAFT